MAGIQEEKKDITFIFHSDWLDHVSGLDIEDQDKVIAEIVRYGAGRELKHADDKVIFAMVNFCKGGIDYSKDKYAEKVENGKKNGGKNKKYTDQIIYEASQGENSSSVVAEKLGCSTSTVNHSAGWVKRNESLEFDEKGNVVYK